MKYLTAFVLLLFAPCLFAVSLLEEHFNMPESLPDGWTVSGPTPSVWQWSSTSYSGGDGGELRLNYTPSSSGERRFISPAIDTRMIYTMYLSFRSYLDDYEGTANPFTIGVQISNDLINWSTLWSQSPVSDLGPEEVSISIPYTYGISETTYIAFWFSGDNYDINGWYLDDISLIHYDSLGIGAWPAGQYSPVGCLHVPIGRTLTLEAGTEIRFAPDTIFFVDGNLRAIGRDDAQILFTSADLGSSWYGFDIINPNPNAASDSILIEHCRIEKTNYSAFRIWNVDRVKISNCTISNNTSIDGVINLHNTDAILENCLVSANTGRVLAAAWSSPVIRYNDFRGNSNNGIIISLYDTDLSNISYNRITGNTSNSETNPFALSMQDCYGVLDRQIIANNQANGLSMENADVNLVISNCLIVNNTGFGIKSSGAFGVKNSVIWGNPLGSVIHLMEPANLSYNCVQGGHAGTSGIPMANFSNNISSDPLFANPSPGSGTDYDALLYDWTLQANSPCIDAGDPGSPLDEDGSVIDIGMYSRRLRPFITHAEDLPADQGRQIDLLWRASDQDASFEFGSFYSVWRESSLREGGLLIDDPDLLSAVLNTRGGDIVWREGDRSWYYLTQVPATAFNEYGLIVPTLMDSSSTGTHEASYKVLFHHPLGLWQSLAASAYSVDNIPPLPAGNLRLMSAENEALRLLWDEVTEGILEGNSYPEINQILYKVYASDDPEVPIEPANLIGTVTDPSILIDSGQSTRFFRVVASDTQ